MPPLSVLVTALCVGAPLAINIKSVLSPFGVTILLLIVAFHLAAFVAGYILTGVVFHKAPDVKALQRTLSYETGFSITSSVINIPAAEFLKPSEFFFNDHSRNAKQSSGSCTCK